MPDLVNAQRRLAVLGRGLVPYDTPILRADDLGALRGDGIFETIHVRGGTPWQYDAHLDRMAKSAVRLNLDLPQRADLDLLAKQALDGWPVEVEAGLRIVCTRGAELGSPVTVYATVAPVAERAIRERRAGIAVVTASIGIASDSRAAAPWLLGGAKTLSYAINMASMRWAAENNADDVLWTSSDGFALEGPTSTLIWLSGGTLWTVPTEPTGILAGTTGRFLLDNAEKLGFAAGTAMITPPELAGAEGVWFTSSVRGVAEFRSLDGVAFGPSSATAQIRELLEFA